MKSSPLIYSFVLLIALMLILPCSEAQYQYYDFGNYYNPYFTPFAQHKNDYFRSGLHQQPQPSYDPRKIGGTAAPVVGGAEVEDRFFFTTVKVTITTSTSTSTITSTTVCTTSTTTLKSCTPSGRRRRGMSLDKEGRAAGLFYYDQEEEGDDGNIFLLPAPSSPKESEVIPQDEPTRIARETPPVPFVIQPGFQLPKEISGNARFLLGFGTATTTITTTTTSISSLIATCKSTTGFQTCGSTGK